MMAAIASGYVNAWCRAKWPEEGAKMSSTMMNASMADVFDHIDYGSHKYIPADKLTRDLGEPTGGGVYGYWKMADGSYVLRTCRGPLAYWSGKTEDAAQWGEFA